MNEFEKAETLELIELVISDLNGIQKLELFQILRTPRQLDCFKTLLAADIQEEHSPDELDVLYGDQFSDAVATQLLEGGERWL